MEGWQFGALLIRIWAPEVIKWTTNFSENQDILLANVSPFVSYYRAVKTESCSRIMIWWYIKSTPEWLNNKRFDVFGYFVFSGLSFSFPFLLLMDSCPFLQVWGSVMIYRGIECPCLHVKNFVVNINGKRIGNCTKWSELPVKFPDFNYIEHANQMAESSDDEETEWVAKTTALITLLYFPSLCGLFIIYLS